jgi:guanylate kinase
MKSTIDQLKARLKVRRDEAKAKIEKRLNYAKKVLAEDKN